MRAIAWNPALWAGVFALHLPLAPRCLAQADRQGRASNPPRQVAGPEAGGISTDIVLLGALAKNPVTAPYRFAVYPDRDRWVLTGRVGTKAIYDEAIQTALQVTDRFIDRLVIDTAAVQAGIEAGQGVPVTMGSVWPWGFHARPGPPPYVYPPPLFQGWWMDPFYGMEPPLITLPPGWAAADGSPWPGGMLLGNDPAAMIAGPRNETTVGPAETQVGQPGPGAGGGLAQARPDVPVPDPQPRAAAPAARPPTEGTNLNLPIEMVIDPRGVAVISGQVPTLEARVAIGQKIASLPGITQVINRLEVAQPLSDRVMIGAAENAPPARAEAQPAGKPPAPLPPADVPPPPLPELDHPAAAQATPAAPNAAPALEPPAHAPPRSDATPDPSIHAPPAPPTRPAPAAAPPNPARQAQSLIDQSPELADQGIRVQDLGQGAVQISGKLPSAYEAMRAYLTVARTPGITAIEDRLEFPLPDTGAPRNPLRDRAAPEDVRDYLSAQINRQLMKQARVERVVVDSSAILVVLQGAEISQRPRFEAAVRSMPLLRGYKLSIEWSRQSP
jgi:hypothetical protein